MSAETAVDKLRTEMRELQKIIPAGAHPFHAKLKSLGEMLPDEASWISKFKAFIFRKAQKERQSRILESLAAIRADLDDLQDLEKKSLRLQENVNKALRVQEEIQNTWHSLPGPMEEIFKERQDQLKKFESQLTKLVPTCTPPGKESKFPVTMQQETLKALKKEVQRHERIFSFIKDIHELSNSKITDKEITEIINLTLEAHDLLINGKPVNDKEFETACQKVKNALENYRRDFRETQERERNIEATMHLMGDWLALFEKRTASANDFQQTYDKLYRERNLITDPEERAAQKADIEKFLADIVSNCVKNLQEPENQEIQPLYDLLQDRFPLSLENTTRQYSVLKIPFSPPISSYHQWDKARKAVDEAIIEVSQAHRGQILQEIEEKAAAIEGKISGMNDSCISKEARGRLGEIRSQKEKLFDPKSGELQCMDIRDVLQLLIVILDIGSEIEKLEQQTIDDRGNFDSRKAKLLTSTRELDEKIRQSESPLPTQTNTIVDQLNLLTGNSSLEEGLATIDRLERKIMQQESKLTRECQEEIDKRQRLIRSMEKILTTLGAQYESEYCGALSAHGGRVEIDEFLSIRSSQERYRSSLSSKTEECLQPMEEKRAESVAYCEAKLVQATLPRGDLAEIQAVLDTLQSWSAEPGQKDLADKLLDLQAVLEEAAALFNRLFPHECKVRRLHAELTSLLDNYPYRRDIFPDTRRRIEALVRGVPLVDINKAHWQLLDRQLEEAKRLWKELDFHAMRLETDFLLTNFPKLEQLCGRGDHPQRDRAQQVLDDIKSAGSNLPDKGVMQRMHNLMDLN